MTHHRSLRRSIFTLPTLTILATFVALSANARDAELSKFIEKNLAEYHVPGAVVVVVKDGEIMHLRGYGVRDIDSKAAVDENTIFQLASVSKTMTAATYAVAVDAGVVGWDTPVRSVFPEFSLHCPYATEWTNGIDLLVHRTGLPPFVGAFYESLGFTREEILERIPLIQPNHSFREIPQYSNLGFFLAGESAAAAMKMTWSELLKAKILDPLNMSRSGLASGLMRQDANTAKPYILNPDNTWREAKPDRQPVLLPAGGLAGSGADMANFMTMMLGKGEFDGRQILSAPSVEKLFTPVVAEEPGFAELPPISASTGFAYTPGWGIYYYKGQRVLEKGGALAGYRTVVMLLPDQNFGAAILCNLNFTAFPEAIRAYLLEREFGGIDGRDFAKEIRERWVSMQELLAAPKLPDQPKPPQLALDEYAGEYSSLAFGTWELREEAGELIVFAGPARFRGKLIPFDHNTFLCRWDAENASTPDLAFEIENGAVIGFLYDESTRFTRHAIPPDVTP